MLQTLSCTILTLRELVTRYVHAASLAWVLSLSTVRLLFSLVGTQLEEDDIQEAHSAADEAWHWPKPRYVQHIGQDSSELMSTTGCAVLFCANQIRLSIQRTFSHVPLVALYPWWLSA